MADPALLASLEGQQYLVLRPVGVVSEFYEAEQAALRSALSDSVTYPNAGHVTLRGFHEPNRVQELKTTILEWATAQPPVELRVEAVDGFPPPFQILISRLDRTPSLVDAYAQLTAALDATSFTRIGELPLEQWTFHLSLLYCSTLTEDEWRAAHAGASRTVNPPVCEVVSEAEYVWYEDGLEHSEAIALGGFSVVPGGVNTGSGEDLGIHYVGDQVMRSRAGRISRRSVSS